MSKKVKEVIALLEINGWRQVRVRGDNHSDYDYTTCSY